MSTREASSFEPQAAPLLADASAESSRGSDTWVRPYFKRYRKQLIQALGLGVLTFLFAAMLMFTSGYLISRCAERPDGGVFIVLWPIAFVQIFGMGKPILRYIERLVSHDWVFRMTSDLRLRLYTALERQAMSLRRVHQTGDFLGLVAEDIGHLQNLYLRTIFPTVIAWVLFACVSIFYGVFDPPFALCMLLLLGLVVFALPLVSLLHNRQRIEREKSLRNARYADLTDNVLGSTDWVFSGRGSDYLEQAKRKDGEIRTLRSGLDSYYRANDLVATVLLAGGALAVLAWSAGHFGNAGLPRADWIAAFVLGFFPLVEAFMPLAPAAAQVNVYRDSVKRLNSYPTIEDDDLGVDPAIFDTVSAVKFAIDDLMGQQDGSKRASPASDTGTRTLEDADAGFAARPEPSAAETSQIGLCGSDRAATSLPEAVDISIRELRFAYEDGSMVLDGLSLEIPAGQKLAILGRSGSGKSTLSSIVRGDLAPCSGTVLVKGKPAGAYGDDMPHTIGVVQQSSYLFNRSLRDNLLVGREDATDEELWEALDAVELGEMARHLPKGLDTMVDEAGMRFSGGERHRIALARVLLARVGAILLDEPTVGLDPATENALLDTLFSTMEDKTLLMVTHHLQGIERFDRVIFIEEGRIVLDGSPTELERESERFRALRSFDKGIAL